MRRQLAAFGVACAVMLVCFAPGALCAAIAKVAPAVLSHDAATLYAEGHALAHHSLRVHH